MEIVRHNPAAYLRSASGKGKFFSFSSNRALQYATRVYHRRGLTQAVRYLEDTFWHNFKRHRGNEKKLKSLTQDLNLYGDEYEALGSTVAEIAKKLVIKVSTNISLGGEISRVDLVNNGGYAVYLLRSVQSDWENELRMPLIQGYYADKLGAPSAEVSVGVYCFETANHESKIFTSKDISEARRELSEIAEILEEERRK